MKAITFGTSKSSATLRTPNKDIAFLVGKQIRTRVAKSIQSESQITSRRAIQTTLSRLPKGLRLTPQDCQIVLFLEKNCAVAYESWPKEYQVESVIEKLKRRGYLTRKYNPNRCGLTRSGFGLARWLSASLEHTATKDRN